MTAQTERWPPGPIRFVLVGIAAAGVHYVVALGLNGALGVPPSWANPLAFATAFPVSYVGHRAFSFAGSLRPHAQALRRFFVVALGSFLGNQALLLALLHTLAWPFWLVLGITLVTVAVATYAFSRYWAFR
ncbi:GtrA family protein [Aquabacterium sp.]|uniref:GtrA family protein n=1 Tax=Aquabacterium sp. TaxID=1872578 RepID=UPI0019A514FF|nr:GtrA family protein [Aquabacterium sp.]MBC7699791.1 GtrA family protein [Aquabacterium sp.]